MLIDADGKNRVRLTHNRVHHWAPAWSPDGPTITYWISNVDILGGATIHLMTADGKYLKQLNDVQDGGDVPARH